MTLKTIGFFLLLGAIFTACGKSGGRCTKQEASLNDPKCKCWCSQICNYRAKNDTDRPVFVENDPNGKFTYCKPWDLNEYQDNCIDHKNIKEQ